MFNFSKKTCERERLARADLVLFNLEHARNEIAQQLPELHDKGLLKQFNRLLSACYILSTHNQGTHNIGQNSEYIYTLKVTKTEIKLTQEKLR